MVLIFGSRSVFVLGFHLFFYWYEMIFFKLVTLKFKKKNDIPHPTPLAVDLYCTWPFAIETKDRLFLYVFLLNIDQRRACAALTINFFFTLYVNC